MPEAEFRGRQYMEQREPFGDRRLDFLFAKVMSVMANLASHSNNFTLKDFMPNWDAELPPVEAINEAAMLEAEHAKFLLFKQGYERRRAMNPLN